VEVVSNSTVEEPALPHLQAEPGFVQEYTKPMQYCQSVLKNHLSVLLPQTQSVVGGWLAVTHAVLPVSVMKS
jgi:hypothetical protein